MTEAKTLTLTEFLLARVAEDERAWSVLAAETAEMEPPIYGPARVLAECEAKRRIVTGHGSPHICGAGTEIEVDDEGAVYVWPCPTLHDLAAVYADHPDYRDDWRP